MDLRSAIREAVLMYRPAHVVMHKGGNYRAYETILDDYTGNIVVIVTDNIHSGGEIIPVGEQGNIFLATMIYEAIGGPNWDQKYVSEISNKAVKELGEMAADLHKYSWERKTPKAVKPLRKVKPIKKLKRR